MLTIWYISNFPKSGIISWIWSYSLFQLEKVRWLLVWIPWSGKTGISIWNSVTGKVLCYLTYNPFFWSLHDNQTMLFYCNGKMWLISSIYLIMVDTLKSLGMARLSPWITLLNGPRVCELIWPKVSEGIGYECSGIYETLLWWKSCH